MIPPPIRPDERSTELHPYSPGPCTSLSPGGWPPILDLPIFKKIPGSIWFSIKVILFLFLYIWVRAAFPRYRYDQLMGLGRKVFLPLSLARVVLVSGLSVTFQWLPELCARNFPRRVMGSGLVPENARSSDVGAYNEPCDSNSSSKKASLYI